MARQFGMTPEAVAHDLSTLHLAEYEDRYDALARRYDPVLLRAAGIEPASAVLDIGCGAGVSTRDAARVAVSGTVVGIDASAPLVKRARQRSRFDGLSNTRFEHGDAAVHPFDPASFDVAISRFGASYFADPVAAFANVARALRPRGRLALLSWRELARNEWMWAVRDALALGRDLPEPAPGAPGPFGLAQPAAAHRVLAGAGFEDVHLEAVDEAVVVGADVEEAFAFVSTLAFARGMLEGLGATDRRRVLEQLRAVLAAHATGAGVLLGAGAWVATARRP